MQTEPPKSDPPKRKRRWFQFSLRTMMVFVTLLCLGLGLNSIRVRANRQRATVEKLRSIKAVVLYDYETDELGNALNLTRVQKPGPEWLVNFLGVDWFATAVHVTAHEIDDGTVEALADLPNLKLLHVVETPPSLFQVVGCLNALRVLELERNRTPFRPLIDEDWKGFENLHQLRHLTLEGFHVKDPALVHLKAATQLEVIKLRHTRISDAALENLEGLKALRHIDLVGSRVSDACLIHLRALPSLKSLMVISTRITSKGIRRLLEDCPYLYVDGPDDLGNEAIYHPSPSKH